MIADEHPLNNYDPYDLQRFIKAQKNCYDTVLAELRNGQKQSHWMWFIFPQIDGLGRSSTAKHYAIKSREETRQYLQHPVLGKRLQECTNILLTLEGLSISGILGYPDDMKMQSSMTLFASLSQPDSIFHKTLDKYFQGRSDSKTLEILASL